LSVIAAQAAIQNECASSTLSPQYGSNAKALFSAFKNLLLEQA